MMNVIKLAALAAVKKIALAALSEALIKKVIIELLEEGAKRTDWELDDRIVAEIKNQMILWDNKNKLHYGMKKSDYRLWDEKNKQ
jgi:hypothetical protein